jgi:hypothetical protein
VFERYAIEHRQIGCRGGTQYTLERAGRRQYAGVPVSIEAFRHVEIRLCIANEVANID